MTLLGPRIGKEDVYGSDRSSGQLLQDLDRVMTDDADIRQRIRLGAEQQVSDAGSMHFPTSS